MATAQTAKYSVIDTLCDLVRINSVNPAYEHGVPEAGIAGYMQQFFGAHGIETVEQTVLPGRPNLIAKIPGQGLSRRLVFEAHMDTAGVAGMSIQAFKPEVKGGKVYGRGACDTKAGLAAMMCAMASIVQERRTPPCEIWLVGAADEEFSYRGVVRLCEGLRADAAVVAEPTSLRLVIATKGCVRFRVVVHGKAAHSAKPHLGVNAISQMARVISALENDAASLACSRHDLLGPATFNIGTISGGTQVNVVPESCAIEIDRRLLPGEEPLDVLQGYADFISSIEGIQAEVPPPLLQDWPLQTPVESSVVRVASDVLAELGLDSTPCGVPYGSDASKLSRIGVPSVVIGPGSIDQAHAAVEFVESAEVEQAFQFYRTFMLSFV
jgi:acetylornithine deacetylase/succinyl-diaminopimelate desuccinylase family protein